MRSRDLKTVEKCLNLVPSRKLLMSPCWDELFLHNVTISVVDVLSGDLPGDLRQGGEGSGFVREQGERRDTKSLLPGALQRLQRCVCGEGEELRGGGFETGAAHGERES